MWKPIILDVECIVCNKTLQKINHDPHEMTRKMGKITNRRSRTPNWSIEEKKYLLELIKERKEVVITKSNNGPNHSEEKDVAWNEILRELAVKFGTKFTGSSIKKVKTQWQNMKRIAREEILLNGTELQKYTRQSLEVCNILNIVQDGVLKREGDNFNLNSTMITTNVEIKAECIDEEMNETNCSEVESNNFVQTENQRQQNISHQNEANHFESSSTLSEHNSEVNDLEPEEESQAIDNNKKDASAMTDSCSLEEINNITLLQKDFHNYFRYTSAEKAFKMESLKEERQIIKAIRETAELNKIIAEQKLKHVLWQKKREME